MSELENEFTDLIAKADALGKAAEAHDKDCTTSCGNENHECFENRCFTVALVMDRLGMSILDIGYIADKLLELQCEAGTRPCGDETPLDEWPATVVDTEH